MVKREIFNAEDLPQDANVKLIKRGKDYYVYRPLRNEDGSINWFATKRNMYMVIMWIAIMLLIIFAVRHQLNQYDEFCTNVLEGDYVCFEQSEYANRNLFEVNISDLPDSTEGVKDDP